MWSNQGPVRDGEADVVAFLKPPLSRATINNQPMSAGLLYILRADHHLAAGWRES
jgi:hypothetical protein